MTDGNRNSDTVEVREGGGDGVTGSIKENGLDYTCGGRSGRTKTKTGSS